VAEGAVSRTLTLDGNPVGAVALVRFTDELSISELDDVPAGILEAFGQRAVTESTIKGITVYEVDKARGEQVGAIAWRDGRDVILTWSTTLRGARIIATRYIDALEASRA
jgi:hypothetical protein